MHIKITFDRFKLHVTSTNTEHHRLIGDQLFLIAQSAKRDLIIIIKSNF